MIGSKTFYCMPPTLQPTVPGDLDTPVNAIYIKGVCAGFVRFKLARPPVKDVAWHCWTIFLASNCGLDLSPFVEKVTFVIHKDFSSYIRSVYDPPYETTVIGQLGFEAFIHITYRDSKLPPSIISIKIVINSDDYTREIYPDMLVFVNPRFWFSRLLDIERICTKQSSILHHLNIQQFVRQENAAGHVPHIFDSATRAALDDSTPLEETVKREGFPRNGTAFYRTSSLQAEYLYPPSGESVGLYQYNSSANHEFRSSVDRSADFIAKYTSDVRNRKADQH